MNTSPYFFISFSSHDMKYVRDIMSALAGQGIPFWDYSDIVQSIETGSSITGRLKEEIDNCTHMIVVLRTNSTDLMIGHYCRLEMEYALSKSFDKQQKFIPVALATNFPLTLAPPYDVFQDVFRFNFDGTPETIVSFTIRVCKRLDRQYIPPIEAHPNLPFWKLFKGEIEELAHSNKEHVDLMALLGEFNEYYKRSNTSEALILITHFINSCRHKIKLYRPVYPWIVKAVCEEELDLLEEAMMSYEKAGELEPDNQDVIGGIGTVHFKLGHYREAVACFERILATHADEDTRNARTNLLISRLAKGEMINETDKHFLFHLDLSEYAADLKTAILNARGIYLRMQKDYSSLESHCRNSISMHLHDSLTVVLLYLSYINRNMKWEALRTLHDAIDEADGNNRLNKTILRISLAEAFERFGMTNEATQVYRNFLVDGSERTRNTIIAFAKFLQRNGHQDEAEKICRRMLSAQQFPNPVREEDFYLDGYANYILGNVERARYDYERSGKRQPYYDEV